MGLSIETLALAKKFTTESIKGITGALAGKNCTIKSVTKVDGVSTVTFEWVANDGTTKTSTMTVADGENGESAYEIAKRLGYEGTEEEWLASLVGEKGDKGVGIESITKQGTSGLVDTYLILFADGSETTFDVVNGANVTKTSQLTNDSEFITNATIGLINYYLKDEVYSKSKIDELLRNVGAGLSVKIVPSLPTEEISGTTIYLVNASGSNYNQYMYIDGDWASLGSTSVDLSSYYNKAQIDTMLLGYVNASTLLTQLMAYTKTADLSKVALSGDYNDLDNLPTIPDVSGIKPYSETLQDSNNTAPTSKVVYDAVQIINEALDGKANTEDVPQIDDSATSTDKVWSAKKVNDSLVDNIGGKNNRKKIAIFGGSVAVNEYNALKDSIKKALNTEIVDNYAINGYGFSSLQGSIQTEVNSAISSGNDYDVFILWASSNDYTNSREIGSYKDYTVLDSYNETKLTTQCGGINYCIKKILEHNPKAEIYFITSYKCYDKESGYNTFYCGKENKLYSYVSAQKQCCAYYSIPILDLWSMMGINELNRSMYYVDDVHINTDGYDKIKNLIIDMIKNGAYNGAPQTEQTKDSFHPLVFASDDASVLELSPDSNKLVRFDPNTCYYTVKNGVCYVNVTWTQTDAVADHTWLLINLPKPTEMIQCIGCSRSLFDGKAIPIYGYIDVANNYVDEFGYKLKIFGGNNDSRGFRMSFSYVIDE